jgi:hypothetical protein
VRRALAALTLLAACNVLNRSQEPFSPLEINASHPAAQVAASGSPVRQDIMVQMSKSQAPITACYREALGQVPTLVGTIEIEVVAQADSGTFVHVTIVRDDLGYPDLDDCVVAEVKSLALEHPQTSDLTFKYQLEFSPSR